jgi:drug/metabolite transporter (DMT)-like permease
VNVPEPNPGNARIGVLWLLCDMALVTAMTVVVKMQGSAYPAIQLVFIRSLVGLITVVPLAWRFRADILGTSHPGRHAFRVGCNAMALTCNFAALTALPLVLVNAIGFMRPLVVMGLAVLMLGERVSIMRWIGAAVGFGGVLVMVSPDSVPVTLGLLAAFGMVLFGSLATVQTRALKHEKTTVLMVFYTVGLTLFTAIPALWLWQPVAGTDWPALIGIGLLAQAGQFCFLRAYQSTPANILAPVGYLTIVFATVAGYVFFAEIPEWTTLAGVAIILVTLQATGLLERRFKGRG